ncbi:hypothetical protein FRC08_001679 [Ceratobasidium sp. 394]|nr:hypothetical protein FRC08_001679 [Ceratobasidium sp. 394]
MDLQQLYQMMAQPSCQQKSMAQSLKDSQQGQSNGSRPKPARVSPPQPCEGVVNLPRLIGLRFSAVATLLRHDDKTKPLPPSPPRNVRVPTVQRFFIQWEETEKSPFNRLAAQIVVDYIREDYEEEGFTQAEIIDLSAMVSEHICYLCRTVKKSNRLHVDELKERELKRASAASWRNTLFESWLKIINHFKTSLGKNRNLVVQLGVDGTSSDEEDPEREGVYLVKRRQELSSNIQVLKSKLDLAYLLYYKGPGTRGSQLHIWEPSTEVSA